MDNVENFDHCHEEGFKAFLRSLGQSDNNPYPQGSEASKHFSLGWKQAEFICGAKKAKAKKSKKH